MREAADFFSSFKDGLVKGIYTSAICRVESYDPDIMKADVTLLPDEVLIPSVPVSTLQTDQFIVRMPYKKGDLVLVVFAMRDIDSIMHSDSATATDRMLSIDDAVVVGGINLFAKPLPKTHVDAADQGNQVTINPNDLLIASKDMKTRFIMPEAGGIKMYDDTDAGVEIVAPMGVTIRADNPQGRGINMIDKP